MLLQRFHSVGKRGDRRIERPCQFAQRSLECTCEHRKQDLSGRQSCYLFYLIRTAELPFNHCTLDLKFFIRLLEFKNLLQDQYRVVIADSNTNRSL